MDADPDVDGGTGNQCISHTQLITEPNVRSTELSVHDAQDEANYNDPFHRFFWMNDAGDVGRMMTIISEAENGDSLLDFASLESVATLHYDRVFNETNGPVLSALVVIPSADLNAQNLGQASSGGDCVTNGGSPITPQPSSLAEWVEDCGVRYLEEEKRGYFFFFSASLDNLVDAFGNEPEQGWADLIRILRVESYDNQTDSEAQFAAIADLYPDIEFHVTSHTEIIPPPNYPEWLLNSSFMLGVEQYGSFIEYYETEAANARTEGNLEALGVPIWQLTPVYDAGGWIGDFCGVQQTDIEQAFVCYQMFEESVRVLKERIEPQVAIYQEAVTNRNEYVQPNDSADWRRFLEESWDPLMEEIDDLRMSCENALQSGDVAEICGTCNVAPIREVISDLGSLTKPRPAIAAQHPTAWGVNYTTYSLTANQSPKVVPITQAMCGMHWISGKFEGGAEAAILSRSGADWVLEAVSNQTATSERLRTQMICTDSITKGGNCDGLGTFCKWYQKCDNGTCVTDPYYAGELQTNSLSVNSGSSTNFVTPPGNVTPILGDKPYLAMFSGISGKMAGLGEEVTVEQRIPALAARVTTESAQGYLKGWSNGVLLTDSSASTHTFFDLEDTQGNQFDATVATIDASARASIEVPLAPANQAYCYLMSVGGEFDGAGESVRVTLKSGTWVAQASSVGFEDCGGAGATGCLSKKVRASVRCIQFDQ